MQFFFFFFTYLKSIFSILHGHYHSTTQLSSSSHTTIQPPSHSTKLLSIKFTYPFNRATIINLPKSKDPKTHLSKRLRDGGKGLRGWGIVMTWATTSDSLSNNEIDTYGLSNKIEPIDQTTRSTPKQQDWVTSAWTLSTDQGLQSLS